MRDVPLEVKGLGGESIIASRNSLLLTSCEDIHGNIDKDAINFPTIADSSVPGIIGLNTLRDKRALLDLQGNKLHFLPAGGFDLLQYLPAGTKSYALERAPSGHLVLPCNRHREPAQEASAPRSSTEDRPSGPDTSRQPGERPHKWACVACQLGLPLLGSRASHEAHHPNVPPHSKVSGAVSYTHLRAHET